MKSSITHINSSREKGKETVENEFTNEAGASCGERNGKESDIDIGKQQFWTEADDGLRNDLTEGLHECGFFGGFDFNII